MGDREIVLRVPLIEEILGAHRERSHGDSAGYDAYAAHAYRVFNFSRALAPILPDRDEKLAVAAAFHDIASFESLDYLGPSIASQDQWLVANHRAPWRDELAVVVAEHHRPLPYRGTHAALAEPFRRADLIDVSQGLITWGLPRAYVTDVRAAFDATAFFTRVVPMGVVKQIRHLRDPLAFMRARRALVESGHR